MVNASSSTALASRRASLNDLTSVSAQIRGNAWVDPVLHGHMGSHVVGPVEFAGRAALDTVEGWLTQHCPPALSAVRSVRQLTAQVTADASLTGLVAAELRRKQEHAAWAEQELAGVQRRAGQWKGASGEAVQAATERLRMDIQLGSNYAGVLSVASNGAGVVLAAAQSALWSAVQQAAGGLVAWVHANAQALAAAGARAAAGLIAAQVSARFGRLIPVMRRQVQGLLTSYGNLNGLLARAKRALLGTRAGGGAGNPPPTGKPGGVPNRVDPADVQEVVRRLHEGAVREEKVVTGLLQKVTGRSGGRLYGLDHRFKTVESLTRKITDEANVLVANGTAPHEAVAKIGGDIKDSLRYTVEADTNNYMSVREKVVKELTDQGYVVVKSKNTWAVPGTPEAGPYRGINEFWRGPGGHVFEVQFHTPEGLAAKHETTVLYEEARAAGTSPERVRDLLRQRIEISDRIPVPPGAVEARH